VEQLSESFDYVLLDCPAGIDTGFHRAVFSASEAIVVATPHISSIRDADKVLTILNSYNLTKTGFIINRVRGDLILDGDMIDINHICELLNADLVGVVPDDDSIATSTSFCSVKSVGNDAFKLLAQNIHNGTNKIYDYTQNYRGIFGGLKRSLRRHLQ
jgi:septum site-determining protein MinD